MTEHEQTIQTRDSTEADRGAFRAYLALGLGLILAGLLFRGPLVLGLYRLEGWVETQGALAPLVMAVVCSLWFALCLPGPVVLGVAGTMFASEPWIGLAVVLFGDTAATIVGFQVSRRLARQRVKRWVGGKPWFEWLEKQLQTRGLYGVFIARMMPFFPNSLANYALGLTPLRFWSYLAASVLGSIPNLALYIFGAAGIVELLRDGMASALSLQRAMALLVLVGFGGWALQSVLRRTGKKVKATPSVD